MSLTEKEKNEIIKKAENRYDEHECPDAEMFNYWLIEETEKAVARCEQDAITSAKKDVEDFKRLANTYMLQAECYKKDRDRLNKEHSIIRKEECEKERKRILEWMKQKGISISCGAYLRISAEDLAELEKGD
jgi:hypothetical protein